LAPFRMPFSRIKDHLRDEMVRSRANQRSYQSQLPLGRIEVNAVLFVSPTAAGHRQVIALARENRCGSFMMVLLHFCDIAHTRLLALPDRVKA
jgi:hypothetical protein